MFIPKIYYNKVCRLMQSKCMKCQSSYCSIASRVIWTIVHKFCLELSSYIAHAIVNVQSCSTTRAMEEYNRNMNTGGASIKVMYAQQYTQQGAMRYCLSKNTKLAY